jgi:hypothetical protein
MILTLTAGVSYWTELQLKSVIRERFSLNSRRKKEEVQVGERTVSSCFCGAGIVRITGRGTSAVGSQYQRTGVGQQTEKAKCVL